MLVEAVLGAFANIVVLTAIPFGVYFCWHKWRHRRTSKEIFDRAGLVLGETKYLGISALAALAIVVAVLLFPPSVELMTREGSAQRPFLGLGLSGTSLVMALLYGIVKTGFPEELLFRGLIAGSLFRRMSEPWANLLQALIFLLPHLALLLFAPEVWPVLILIYLGSLFLGWIRFRSGSICGPWLIHAAANVATCLSVAIRSG